MVASLVTSPFLKLLAFRQSDGNTPVHVERNLVRKYDFYN